MYVRLMRSRVVPGGLAGLPPGPALAAILDGIALADVPNDQMLEVVRALCRQLSHTQARMAAAIAEVGRCAGFTEPGEVVRLTEPGPYAADESRAALAWTRRCADREHELAETVVHAMPAVFEAWLAGDLDRARVVVFERHLVGLGAEQVAEICRVALPRASGLTTGQLAVLLRRMVIAVDPDAAERWYRQGIADRNVTAHLDADGTAVLSANGLPADQAEAACVRLQDLAAAARRAGHPGLIGQIRCDLFLGLLDGRFHHMTSAQIIDALIADHQAETADSGPGHAESGHPAAPPDVEVAGAAEPPGSECTPGSAESADPAEPARPAEPTVPADPARSSDPGEPARRTDPVESPDQAASARSADPADPARPANQSDGLDPADLFEPGRRVRDPAQPVRNAPVDVRVGIEIRVGLGTLLGRDEHPGEIPGLGLLPAIATRARVAAQRRAQWRFAVTDTAGRLVAEGITRRRPPGIRRDGPPGGIVEMHVPSTLLTELLTEVTTNTSTGTDTSVREWAGVIEDIAFQYARRDSRLADLDSRPTDRLPAAALRRHTEIRDRTCVFTGCRHRARSADQDHTHDHNAGGATVRTNLGPVCRHDHRVKHAGGWQVSQPEPGDFRWRSPLGGEYRTRGEFLQPMPQPCPAKKVIPRPESTPTANDGAILRRPVWRPSWCRQERSTGGAALDEPPPF